jgi:hypothetical protein
MEAAVAAELIAAAAIKATEWVARRFVGPQKVPLDPGHLEDVLSPASIVDALSGDLDSTELSMLQAFVSAPEFHNVVQQLALVRAAGGPSDDVQAVKGEFLLLLRLYATFPSEDIPLKVFGAILQAVDQSLRQLYEAGVELGDSLRSEALATVVKSHLGAIARNTEILAQGLTSTESVVEFENTYRAQVAARHRLIMPPNFGGSKRVPLESLYVAPYLEQRARSDELVPARTKFDDFVKLIHRTVVLGDPGGGKSTMSQKICLDLSSADLFTTNGRVTPILVVLRDYGATKERKSCSIRDFIAEIMNATYQVVPPVGALDFLLLNGRALVIFDGLDELLDSSYRREISGDVESFCNLYPTTSVLVTSRLVGYDEAPLDPVDFDVFKLSEMDYEQVEEYATKWFFLDEGLSADERSELANKFISESEVVADLRRNPLMLSLMCNIYKGENYIPANRPDVYEKCAVMLFERWDVGRGIKYGLPFKSLLRPTMMHLAFEVYSTPGLQGGVSRSALEQMTTAYLLERRYDDVDDARQAARDFVEFCTGRAWVFTDVGTTSAGERLYQFTHRTFLEYFTAGYLVRRHPTPDALFAVLEPRVTAAEWDVVAQLAIQMQNSNVESAGELLLMHLSTSGHDRRAKANALSFCARCLQFLVPSIRETKKISVLVTAMTMELMEEGTGAIDIGSIEPAEIEVPLGPLMACAEENLPAVQSAVLESVIAGLTQGRRGAGDIVWGLEPLFTGAFGGSVTADRAASWSEKVLDLRSQHSDALVELAMSDAAHAIFAMRAGLIDVEAAVTAHGFEVLTYNAPARLTPVWYFSIVEQLAQNAAWPIEMAEQQGDDVSAIAGQFAGMLSGNIFPWAVRSSTSHGGLMDVLVRRHRDGVEGLNPGTQLMESGAVAVAILIELSDRPGHLRTIKPQGYRRVLGALEPMFPLVETWLRGNRLGRSRESQARTGLAEAGLREQVIELLIDWAAGHLAFTDRAQPAPERTDHQSDSIVDG